MSSEARPSVETLSKRPFGFACWYCKQPVLAGYAYIESTAQNEDLQNNPQAAATGGSCVFCEYVYPNGVECGAVNHIDWGSLVFLDEPQAPRNPENRRLTHPRIPGFKTPEEADQERKDARTFWSRMGFVLVISAISGAILSGLLGIVTVAGILAVCGLVCFVLTMCLIKEAQ
jgi:hypothetical protein